MMTSFIVIHMKAVCDEKDSCTRSDTTFKTLLHTMHMDKIGQHNI